MAELRVEQLASPMVTPEWVPDGVGMGVGIFATPPVVMGADQVIDTNAGGNPWLKFGTRVGIGLVDAFAMAQTFARANPFERGVFYGALSSLLLVFVSSVQMIAQAAGVGGLLAIGGAKTIQQNAPPCPEHGYARK